MHATLQRNQPNVRLRQTSSKNLNSRTSLNKVPEATAYHYVLSIYSFKIEKCYLPGSVIRSFAYICNIRPVSTSENTIKLYPTLIYMADNN